MLKTALLVSRATETIVVKATSSELLFGPPSNAQRDKLIPQSTIEPTSEPSLAETSAETLGMND